MKIVKLYGTWGGASPTTVQDRKNWICENVRASYFLLFHKTAPQRISKPFSSDHATNLRQSRLSGAHSLVQAYFEKIGQLWTVVVQFKFWWNCCSELLSLGISLLIQSFTQKEMGSVFASHLQFAIVICNSWFKTRNQLKILNFPRRKYFPLSSIRGLQYRLIVILSQLAKRFAIKFCLYKEPSHSTYVTTLPGFILVLETIDGFQFLFQSLPLLRPHGDHWAWSSTLTSWKTEPLRKFVRWHAYRLKPIV